MPPQLLPSRLLPLLLPLLPLQPPLLPLLLLQMLPQLHLLAMLLPQSSLLLLLLLPPIAVPFAVSNPPILLMPPRLGACAREPQVLEALRYVELSFSSTVCSLL